MSLGKSTRQPAPKKKLAGIDASRTSTHQQAIPVLWMAGRNRVPLQWITPAYDVIKEPQRQSAGKGRQVETGTMVYASIAGLICLGGRRPLDGIFMHIIEEEVRWRNDAGLARDTDPYEPITISDFAATRIYWGSETQPVDTLVLTPRGATPSLPGYDPRIRTTWPNANWSFLHPEP
jgi:hypothetical protein